MMIFSLRLSDFLITVYYARVDFSTDDLNDAIIHIDDIDSDMVANDLDC